MNNLRKAFLLMTILLASIASFLFIRKKSKKDHIQMLKEIDPLIQFKQSGYLSNQMTDDPDSTYLESEKMLSEGSQYGIHYYNELEQ